MEGALRRLILLLTKSQLRLLPAQRWPIHPDNAPATHLASVSRESRQSRPMVSGHADSVDQTVARSLRVLMKINGAPCLTHTSRMFKWTP